MKIAPSILTADFTDLKNEIKSISNADLIHIDIMDGNFVPNISFGPAINKQIAKISNIDLDVHLMVTNPLMWIDEFSLENVKYITVHYESQNFLESIKRIKENKKLVGITIKPKTKVSSILDVLKLADLVLVMSVEPGFGGQKFMPEMLDKVRELKRLREENNYNYQIEIDGGINNETIKLAKEAGVDISVVGSYLFNQTDRNKVIDNLK
ncbi:ribulose-phosphate 3-epimerase [Haploplasma modicum]|jgi:ribulose-phosphate 3-epimerase|uniref:ribulose-phosphate 3-epimerase n=1 Tax=Haploplasma modicum TaxID=2150 RepID=UPI00138ABD09|nr:ribulose-phosphate 3-epimerase [Haploplasma modicum]MCR1808710.1 ribulose-phosphate 3-epimerase [Haploplasma modicum]